MNFINKLWIENLYIGKAKKIYYILIQKIFHFRKWHISPINEREYAIWIVDELNIKKIDKKVVEVGCGLGEIIGNINAKYKIGFDIQKEAIAAAQILHPFTKFISGGFSKIVNLDIEYLIIVNFTHGMDSENLRRKINTLDRKNNIKNIIMDVSCGPNYKYQHNLEKIIGSNYKIIKKSKQFFYGSTGKRWIEIYERKEKK